MVFLLHLELGMLKYLNRRWVLGASGLACWAAVAFAYFYLERTLYMVPCPLCMMQRLAFGLIGLAFLVEAIANPKSALGYRLARIFTFLSIGFGMALAARHIHIQNLPAGEAPKCGLDFYGLVEKDWFSGLWQAMQGTGDCATRDLFWGLTLPTWSMMLFVGLLLIAVLCGKPRVRKD